MSSQVTCQLQLIKNTANNNELFWKTNTINELLREEFKILFVYIDLYNVNQQKPLTKRLKYAPNMAEEI